VRQLSTRLTSEVLHVSDRKVDSSLPANQRASWIHSEYDRMCIIKRNDLTRTGVPAISLTPLIVEKRSSDGLADTILKTVAARNVRVLIIGSFGLGGEKKDSLGTLPDALTRMFEGDVIIVKNWAPIPDPANTKFVIAVDNSPAAVAALEHTVSYAPKTSVVQVLPLPPPLRDGVDFADPFSS
jgi:hypothetical protein